MAAEGAITEGSAEILPVAAAGAAAAQEGAVAEEGKTEGRKKGGEQKPEQSVFYNPAQVFNRDLSVLVLNVFSALRASEEEEKKKAWLERDAKRREMPDYKPPKHGCPDYKGLSILEGLSASGLRTVRYWKEVKGVESIVANDLDATAVSHIRRNLEHNGVPPDRVRANQGDANLHLYNNAKAYDVVDLDPYGTASPFLDAAMVGVKNGGLLCVTSTDMPILGGNNPEVCFYRYGGTALKASYVHEMSLRLLMNAIAATAARHQRHVEPLLSCSIDFYVRVFVRVHDKPVLAKELASKTGLVYQCCQCQSFHIQPMGMLEYGGKAPLEEGVARPVSKYKVPKALESIGGSCDQCGGRYSIGGPCYLGSLFQKDFLDACLTLCDSEALEHVTSWRKITGLLAAMSEELPDVPLHYSLPSLCGSLRLDCAPAKNFKGALQQLGYRVSHFHREPAAIKTDAPNSAVYDVVRKWAEVQGRTPGAAPSAAADAEMSEQKQGRKAAKKQRADPLAAKILEKAISTPGLGEMDFMSLSLKDEERPRKVPRFLPNPEKFWGPKPRAKPSRPGAEEEGATPGAEAAPGA